MTPPTLPSGMTLAEREELYAMAHDEMSTADRMRKALSGADVVDAEIHDGVRRVYIAVSMGMSVAEAFEIEDRKWRAFAAEQNRKVDSAPKEKRGPYSGQSVMRHRWAYPERFEGKRTHVFWMVRDAKRRAVVTLLKAHGLSVDEAKALTERALKEGPHVVAEFGIEAIKAAVTYRAAERK